MPNSRRRSGSLRKILTVGEFAHHHSLPKEVIEKWVRAGRLNARNGLVVRGGRAYIDASLFEPTFS